MARAIRNSFYAGDARWFKDQHFIRRHVVTWPAAWLNAKGVTLSPLRFKEIVLGVLKGIKQHGRTEVVKYWPGYLKHCLQTHFRIHGEEYYEEAKAMRHQVERALLACQRPETSGPDPIEAIAMARRLMVPGRRPKTPAKQQMNLL
jgi:hypothetical protein